LKTRFAVIAALVIAYTGIPQAIAGNVGDDFVRALQHREFDNAATLFDPESPGRRASITAFLKRLDEQVGGLPSIHRAATLPNGKSIKVLMQARPNALESVASYEQFPYVAIARDGQTVYYQLDLSRDGKAPRVLAFAVGLPASDAQSEKRAVQLARAINP
jgi:hypothetical protein